MANALNIASDWVVAFNDHDEEKLRALTADDAIIEAPGDVRFEGGDATTGYATTWMRAFPDATITVHGALESGNWVVQPFIFKGNHTETLASPSGDVPATNRTLTGRAVQLVRVEADTIAEFQLYFDQVQVLEQLGLMSE